jgi:hypothetical protein
MKNRQQRRREAAYLLRRRKMKIDFERKLLTPKGEEFSDKATVATAAYAALSAPLPEDQAMPMDVKMKLYRLTQTVAAGGILDLSLEDIVTIKARACKALPVVGFGALSDALESKAHVVEIDRPAESAAG